MALNLRIEDNELPGLREVLRRACNTWEPAHQPPWVQEMIDIVDQRLAKLGQGTGAVPRPVDISVINMRALFDNGQECQKQGMPHEANPYLAGTPEHKSWSSGWTHAWTLQDQSSAV